MLTVGSGARRVAGVLQGGAHGAKGEVKDLANAAAASSSSRSQPLAQPWLPAVFGLWSLGLSLWFMPYYVDGDQVMYRYFYDTREGVDLAVSYEDYGNLIGSQEPFYFALVTAFSGWCDKDLLMSLFNGMFGYFVGRGLALLDASKIVTALLAVNFYMVILFFSAERFKLGVLFISIAFMYRGLARYAAVVVAVMSHVQVLLVIVAQLVANAAKALPLLLRGRVERRVLWTVLGPVLGSVALVPVIEYTLNKLAYYHEGSKETGAALLMKPVVFFALTAIYAGRERVAGLALQATILSATAVVGTERLVIFSYMIFMYYGLQVRRGVNAGVLLTCIYFAATGIVALSDTYYYGNAFYWKIPTIMRFF
jgi:hypothetical protein